MGQNAEITPELLHGALTRGEMFLEYQPTIALLENERCVGCEALVRWRRGQQVVYPGAFVPVIENTPVSGLLTYWVIDTVAAELGAWLRAHRTAHVGINVPPEVLGRGGLEYASRKARLLELRGQILLELTERGVPDSLGMAELECFVNSRVMVAVDDLSMNESNFIVLSRLPVAVIKLDKSFVDRLGDPRAQERLREISAFIRIAGHYVVAEGVEHREQARVLREASVQYAQGWLYSKSLSAADFIGYHGARGNAGPSQVSSAPMGGGPGV